MRHVILLAALLAAACSRTDDGKVVIDRPGSVEVKSTQDTLSLPKVEAPKVDVGSRTDTITVPRVRVSDSGISVTKTKKAVTHPTIDVKKP